MKKAVIGSAIIIVYTNVVPYVCRLWRGAEWASQYLPDEGHRLSGMFFFGTFATLPSIPLVVAFLARKWIPLTASLSFIVATFFLVLWHHDYDLASDAQSAIGLLVIPLYVTLITFIISGFIAGMELLIRRKRKISIGNAHRA
jgi:hypothetical protein